MTLVEFIAPLKKGTHLKRILAVLYFHERYEQKTAMTVSEIRQSLKRARAPGYAKVNVADVVNKCGALVDTSGLKQGTRLWNLTDSGREHVRTILDLPKADIEIEHDVGILENLSARVGDNDVREYLEEALRCLRVGALRACVVFVWTGAIRKIQIDVMAKGSKVVTAEVQKHDPKGRRISKLDDFAYVKDEIVLRVAKHLGLLDKNQKDTLTEALGLRNRCSHPSKYRPGIKRVSAFLEDVIQIVFV